MNTLDSDATKTEQLTMFNLEDRKIQEISIVKEMRFAFIFRFSWKQYYNMWKRSNIVERDCYG